MTNRHCQRLAFCVLFACLCSGAASRATAQFFPSGGGGIPGQTPGGRSGTSGNTRQYQNNTQIGEAMISSDPESRRLVIVTDEDTNLQISQVISNLDRPKPQVLIKVVFLEVTYNNSSDVGVEGGFGKKIGGSTTSAVANAFGLSGLNSSATGGVLNAFGQNVTSFVPTPPGAGLYQIFGQDYQVTLRAIAQAGNAEVLSRPSILARNSQPATITVGQSVPLTTSVRFDTFGNAINSVTYTDVGIILRVTPFITSDGMVEMIISPELSSVSATDKIPISTGVTAPVIDKRTADTVVVTPDGQTVIIGGLMGRTKTKTESKVPFLGDIPLLGAAFRRKGMTDVKTELMIFLTPHVVLLPTQLSALSASERAKSDKPKAITEDELNRFLDQLPVKRPEEPEKKSKPNGRPPK